MLPLHLANHGTNPSNPNSKTQEQIRDWIISTSDQAADNPEKMAVGFRRRLAAALTVHKASPYLRHKELSCSWSASLPGRFHSVVAGLHVSVSALLGWTQAPVPAQAGKAWIVDGMDHVNRLLAGLTDMLHHQQVQDPERRRCQAASSWTERLLRDLILLANAHSYFCEVLLSLKQLLDEAQAAVRHRDATRLAAALCTRRRSDRALSSLAATLRAVSHRSNSPAVATSDSGEAALADAVAVATCAVASASAAIFAGLASASASTVLRALTSPTAASPTRPWNGCRIWRSASWRQRTAASRCTAR
ncbi:hypothetical protein ACQ4PT_011648 [Festuca glaucescens]